MALQCKDAKAIEADAAAILAMPLIFIIFSIHRIPEMDSIHITNQYISICGSLEGIM